eukprot:1160443-Pelagomonas_calceolata.AAC.9
MSEASSSGVLSMISTSLSPARASWMSFQHTKAKEVLKNSSSHSSKRPPSLKRLLFSGDQITTMHEVSPPSCFQAQGSTSATPMLHQHPLSTICASTRAVPAHLHKSQLSKPYSPPEE